MQAMPRATAPAFRLSRYRALRRLFGPATALRLSFLGTAAGRVAA